ncbi:hypothetical protein TNIN_36851 [Trichonephila inaurata madagascariensis]|uniref:Uncharacterized protein n=1 Tax=Trichonephila inaurata madagascariensis TaxID=2747483 RepID=A0A8X6Y3U6_9ARAC|nr:hypothetical protein TNIN_36851 [Trichonephila inaurata madagascariensis]
MGYKQWLEIFSTISADNNLNESNVIEKIREELKKGSPEEYQKWERAGFDLNCRFEIEGSRLALLHLAAENGYAKIEIVSITEDVTDSRKEPEQISSEAEINKTKESLKKLEEEQVNNKYQLIKEYLCSSFERCSFTLRDCSLMDIAEDSFDNLMRIWFVYTSNSIKSENEKKLNEELLSVLSSSTEFFGGEDDYIKKLERFLQKNKNNQDLKTVLNLRRGESGFTVLHALSSMAEKDEAYDNAVGLILRTCLKSS